MPTYRYRCAKCGDELEEWQSFADAPLTRHRQCGGKLAKVLSTPGIVLKGSGFYRTDSRNGSSKRSPEKADDTSGGDDGGTKADKKVDKKADTTDAATSASKKTSSKNGSASSGESVQAKRANAGDAAAAD